MAVNFRELLSVNTDSIQAPKPLPEGTYYGTIHGSEFGDNNKNRTPYVRYTVNIHSPGEDIDSAELDGVDLAKRKLSQNFFLTPDSLFRLKNFLISLGLKVEGMTLDELIPEAYGQEVKLYVTQRLNPECPDDPPRNDIKTIAGVA